MERHMLAPRCCGVDLSDAANPGAHAAFGQMQPKGIRCRRLHISQSRRLPVEFRALTTRTASLARAEAVMPVELQVKETALVALVTRSVQERLFTMCVGPFGTHYIDHADV